MPRLTLTKRRPILALHGPCHLVFGDRRSVLLKQGEITAIELPPGRYELAAKIGWLQSRCLEIELAADDRRHFEVAEWVTGWCLALSILYDLVVGAAWLWFQFPAHYFLIAILPGLLPTCFLWGMGRRSVLLREASPSTEKGDIVATRSFRYADLKLFAPRPARVRIRLTVRGIMIAIAVLAVVFWLGLSGCQLVMQAVFTGKAQYHSAAEARWRANEEDSVRHAEKLERQHVSASLDRAFAAKHGARADYHRTMRLQYERAAALGSLSVEPDPPAPPFP